MYSEEMRLDDLDLVDLAECGVEMFSEEVLRGCVPDPLRCSLWCLEVRVAGETIEFLPAAAAVGSSSSVSIRSKDLQENIFVHKKNVRF